jgi:hypothetical protein
MPGTKSIKRDNKNQEREHIHAAQMCCGLCFCSAAPWPHRCAIWSAIHTEEGMIIHQATVLEMCKHPKRAPPGCHRTDRNKPFHGLKTYWIKQNDIGSFLQMNPYERSCDSKISRVEMEWYVISKTPIFCKKKYTSKYSNSTCEQQNTILSPVRVVGGSSSFPWKVAQSSKIHLHWCW